MKKKSRTFERKKAVQVNPFLSIMYRGMAYRTWSKLTKLYRKRRDFEAQNQLDREDSEVEVEIEISEYTFETDRYETLED